jgi:hypothetical protein
MTPERVIEIVAEVAKGKGFRRRGAVVWKAGAETTAMLQVQRSQWSRDVYLNVGVLPNALVVRPYPPPAHMWGHQQRADKAVPTQAEVIRRLSSELEYLQSEDEVRLAVEAVLEWLAVKYLDADRLRAEVLASEHAAERGLVEDWARGEQQDGRLYWPGTAYYSSAERSESPAAAGSKGQGGAGKAREPRRPLDGDVLLVAAVSVLSGRIVPSVERAYFLVFNDPDVSHLIVRDFPFADGAYTLDDECRRVGVRACDEVFVLINAGPVGCGGCERMRASDLTGALIDACRREDACIVVAADGGWIIVITHDGVVVRIETPTDGA